MGTMDTGSASAFTDPLVDFLAAYPFEAIVLEAQPLEELARTSQRQFTGELTSSLSSASSAASSASDEQLPSGGPPRRAVRPWEAATEPTEKWRSAIAAATAPNASPSASLVHHLPLQALRKSLRPTWINRHAAILFQPESGDERERSEGSASVHTDDEDSLEAVMSSAETNTLLGLLFSIVTQHVGPQAVRLRPKLALSAVRPGGSSFIYLLGIGALGEVTTSPSTVTASSAATVTESAISKTPSLAGSHRPKAKMAVRDRIGSAASTSTGTGTSGSSHSISVGASGLSSGSMPSIPSVPSPGGAALALNVPSRRSAFYSAGGVSGRGETSGPTIQKTDWRQEREGKQVAFAIEEDEEEDEADDEGEDDDDDDEATDDVFVKDFDESAGVPDAINQKDRRQRRKGKMTRAALNNLDDFTRALRSTAMGRMISEKDWSSTKIGPPSSWKPEIRAAVRGMLSSPFREAIYVGEDLEIIYNDSYIAMAGRKHPELLGKKGLDAWPEIAEFWGPSLTSAFEEGQVLGEADRYFKLQSRDYETRVEENYLTWVLVPYWGAAEAPIAVTNTIVETTDRILLERRMNTLRDLVEATAAVRTTAEYCSKVLASLATNAWDVPFAMLYEVDIKQENTKDAGTGNHGEVSTPVQLVYRGGVGVPVGHALAPELVDIVLHHQVEGPVSSNSSGKSSYRSPTPWPYEDACVTQAPSLVNELPDGCRDFESRGWEERPAQAVVIPCAVDPDARVPTALLVCGINGQGRYDEDYRMFFAMLARAIATGLAAVANTEYDARKTEELIAIDRMKATFYSQMSHELRTPLTLILGPLEDALGSKSLNSAIRSKLKMIERNSQRLLHTVNSLLDVSQLEMGTRQLYFRPARLSAIVAELSSMFQSAISRKGLALTVECEPDLEEGELVYLSLELFEKAIFNLLGNAVKYTQKGGIAVKVTYTASEAHLEVKDTGIGLEKEDLERIFNKLFRADNKGTRSQEGTGLGLSLTLEVVKAHGGVVDVDSEAGIGSTFIVKVPRGSAHLPEDQVVSSEAVAEARYVSKREVNVFSYAGAALPKAKGDDVPTTYAQSIPSDSSVASGERSDSDLRPSSGSYEALGNDLNVFAGETVVVCEDNEDLRVYVAGLLRRFVRVVTFADGLSALEYIVKQPPSLILSDIMMPGLDGLELLQEVRSTPATALIPVILLSAAGGPEARASALEQGADDFLTKPMQSRELVARVRVHLQIGQMRSDLERQVQERSEELVRSERTRADIQEERAVEADMGRRSLERFIDFVSHELRNPLNGVWQNTMAIQENLERWASRLAAWRPGHCLSQQDYDDLEHDCADNLESLASIVVCAAHQGRIADDILTVSKLTTGLLSLNPVAFDLPARMAATVKAHSREAKEKNITLTLVREGVFEKAGPKIIGDPDRVVQVVLNFLTNAIKYSSDKPDMRITIYVSGGPMPPERTSTGLQIGHPKVVPSVEPTLWAQLRVQDTGKGMSPKEMQRLFARFSQINPMTDQFNGSGLGLFITRQLVDLQGGCIDVESEAGVGSTFAFTFPFFWASASPHPPLARMGSSDNSYPGSPVAATREKQILVVEDNLINQKILRKQLEGAGHHVQVANNGLEAIQMLTATGSSSVFDAVLMDIEMPVMDGITAVKRIRAMEAAGQLPGHLPVVAITGNARTGQITECMEAGMSQVLPKPYQLQTLLQTINQYAGGIINSPAMFRGSFSPDFGGGSFSTSQS